MRVLTLFFPVAVISLVSCSKPQPSAPKAASEVLRQTVLTGRPVELVVLRDNASGVEAAIAPSEGGELSSIRVRFQNRWIELIEHARDYSEISGWRGKAPFLWPATGRTFAKGMKPVADLGAIGGYDWKGKRYPMPLHGFARSMSWQLENSSTDDFGASARLTLKDTPETRRSYPFGFDLAVDYRLRGKELTMLYSISASSANTEAMFFSAGNHITFRTPFVDGSDPLAMQMETPCTTEYLKTPEGIPTGVSRPRSVATSVKLADFDARSAVSLGGYTGDPWLRLTDPAGLKLTIKHHADRLPPPPLVQFNVWGDPANGYFSPEPWVGLQDSFVLRKGLVELPPGETWRWNVQISLDY
jgi:galactose mutarotase-like enzyme